jgi:hypothetical protein
MTLVLDNADGRFTVGSTIIATPSPIKTDRQIRVKVTPSGGTAVTRFTHYVQNWPVEWPDGSDQFAVASITGTDAQPKAERRPLRSVVEEEILLDSPKALYTLGEPAGVATAADSTGNNAPMLTMAGSSAGTAVAFGNAIGTNGLTAAQFTNTSRFLSTGVATVLSALDCAFTCTSPGTGVLYLVAGPYLYVDAAVTGKVKCDIGLTGGPVVTDGAVHTAGLRFDGTTAYLFVDGVSVASTAFAFPSIAPVLDVGGYATAVGGATGLIAEVAIFATDPGAARLTAHSTAMLTGFQGEDGAERITRLAGYAGLTVGTMDPGLTPMPPA